MADIKDLQDLSAAGKIGELAWKALIEEVVTTPKPGLVDLYSNGAHTDMDVDTFRRSAEALRPFFVTMAQMGVEETGSAQTLFRAIRKTGMDAEKAMYAATGGVNTHKGIIFTFGVFCAAAGRCLREKKELTPVNLLHMQQEMTVQVLIKELQELRRQAEALSGEKTGEKSGKESGEKTGEKSGKESGEKTGEDTGKKTGEDTGKNTGEKDGEKSGEDTGKKTGGNTGEKTGMDSGAADSSCGKRNPQPVYAERNLQHDCKEMNPRPTHGEENLQRYGTAGIRGEAIAGYPGIFSIGLPVLREGLERGEDWNRIKLQTLISLMAQTEDSNILSRGGIMGQWRRGGIMEHGLAGPGHGDKRAGTPGRGNQERGGFGTWVQSGQSEPSHVSHSRLLSYPLCAHAHGLFLVYVYTKKSWKALPGGCGADVFA